MPNLDCIKNWYNNNSVKNFSSSSLTEKFDQILSNLNNNNRKINIQKMINELNKSYESLFNKNFDYHPNNFLSFFLDLLHYENNIPIEENYDFSSLRNEVNNEKIEDMYNTYESHLKKTQNSIISKNFFNIIGFHIQCQKCNSSNIYFTIEKMTSFDLDEFPSQNGNNHSLNDCFTYYTKPCSIICKNCNEYKASENKKICNNSDILIINFNRISHNDKCDIDFPDKLTIKNEYILNKAINKFDFNPNYTLKACISFSPQKEYFAYININSNWYKYIDSGSKIARKYLPNQSKDIRKYEPQILIYELYKYYQNISFNNVSQQKQQKKGMKEFNYIRLQYLKQKIKFILIPENQEKTEKVNLNDTIENVITKFLIKNNKTRDDYKLFIFNGMKLDINSKQTLKEFILSLHLQANDKNNLIIFVIKGI